MSTTSQPSTELGDFLKARRAALSPHTVGLPGTGGNRRVAGLRREEVARLASISTDYYTRLEQGRRRAPTPLLNVLAQVLRLNDDECAYLHELANGDSGTGPDLASQTVQPQLRRVLDGLTTMPALVLGRHMDVLAWNPLAAVLLTDFSRLPDEQRNYAWLLFRDPVVRALHPNFERVGPVCVAMLRMEAGRHPDDLRMQRLVSELRRTDEAFSRWWSEHHVAVGANGTKMLRHPVVGDLTLDWDALTCAHDPSQRLVVWTAEPGTPTHDRLVLLAELAAGATPRPPRL